MSMRHWSGSFTSRASKVPFTSSRKSLLARRLVGLGLALASVLADLEREGELAAGHLVERLREQRRVLRLLGELAVERGLRGNSTVSVSSARPFGCASRRTEAVGIECSSTAGRIVRCHASCSGSSSSDGGPAGAPAAAPRPPDLALPAAARGLSPGHGSNGTRARAARAGRPWTRATGRQPAASPSRTRARAAAAGRRPGAGPRPRPRAGRTAEDRRLAELVRLLAQPVARLLGHRQRVGHLAEVLDEHQVPQVLEQVGDEPPEVLSLLGELLDERQRAGRVAVDDEVESRKSASSSTAPSSCRTDCTVTFFSVAAASWSSVDSASRYEPRASARSAPGPRRALRSPRRRDPRRRSCTSSGSRGREKENVWQRERTVGSTFAGRSCRRRRRGGAEAPRSASGARSRRRP